MGNLLEDLQRALSIMVSTTAPRGADREFIVKTLQAAVQTLDIEEVIAEIELQEQIEETELDTAIEEGLTKSVERAQETTDMLQKAREGNTITAQKLRDVDKTKPKKHLPS